MSAVDGGNSTYLPYEISGSYLESCNCDPICPCREVDGVRGGRSTHGVCRGVISWVIEEGRAGELDLAGTKAVLVIQYDDDEKGSPWRVILHVDRDGDETQREALAKIVLGRLGGTVADHFPWVWKPSETLAILPSEIEIDHTPGRGRLRVGERVELRVRGPIAEDHAVRCVIPGYEMPGRELVVERLAVDDDPYAWSLTENCAFESSFSYSSKPR